MSTAVVLTFDPATDRLCFAAAGHPPPIVLEADGRATFLESTPSVPLGILPYGRYHAYEGTLGPGSTLLLYTDGLVERRGESLDDGFARLQQAAACGPEDPQQLCDHILARLLPDEGSHDDVTAVVVKVG
jgi:serine phosphatase RsbU (regulator of sigma subunit)